jgi:hypothetical protein
MMVTSPFDNIIAAPTLAGLSSANAALDTHSNEHRKHRRKRKRFAIH